MSRILGGAKGRFCPVAGGGWSLCVSLPVGGRGLGLCPVALCPVALSITTGEDGRTVARPGSLQARPGVDLYRIGPASDLARVGWLYRGFSALRDFWPCRASLLPCTALSRPGWPVVPARVRSWPVGLLWASGGALVGWVGIACGPAVSIWGGRRAWFILGPCFALSLPVPCL